MWSYFSRESFLRGNGSISHFNTTKANTREYENGAETVTGQNILTTKSFLFNTYCAIRKTKKKGSQQILSTKKWETNNELPKNFIMNLSTCTTYQPSSANNGKQFFEFLSSTGTHIKEVWG